MGTISVTFIPVLSYRKKTNGTRKKMELREIGEVSEEAVKGDVRSHAIRYVRIVDAVQKNANRRIGWRQLVSRSPSLDTDLKRRKSLW